VDAFPGVPIMKFSKLVFALPLLGLFAATGADAAVIFNNGGPDHTGGFFYSDSNLGFGNVEDFSLTAGNNVIGGVNWWGTCSTAGPVAASCATGNFTINIYADTGTGPGALLNTFAVGNANQTATGVPDNGFTDYSYSAAINLTLTAGTTYWLGISDTVASGTDWGWDTTATLGDGHYASFTGAAPWSHNPADLAFNLVSPAVGVPEPLTLSLLGAGLAGLGMIRRRKRG
jgi:hypothetical protein